VSTHITRSASNNNSTSNQTTTNKGTPQTTIVQQPAPQTTTVYQQAPSTSSGSSGGSSSSDGGGLTNQYGNISASSNVSSGLANNVFYEYWAQDRNAEENITLQAYDPATSQYYTTDCMPGADVVSCSVEGTTNNPGNTYVQFSNSAVQAYTQADANSYTANHNLGPNG